MMMKKKVLGLKRMKVFKKNRLTRKRRRKGDERKNNQILPLKKIEYRLTLPSMKGRESR
jgi:hypothetical protein